MNTGADGKVRREAFWRVEAAILKVVRLRGSRVFMVRALGFIFIHVLLLVRCNLLL